MSKREWAWVLIQFAATAVGFTAALFAMAWFGLGLRPRRF
jgi:hypothetical protein